jgi:hypothetical protein
MMMADGGHFAVGTDSADTATFLVRSPPREGSCMTRKLLVILALVGLLSAVAISHASAATQTTSNVVNISDPTATPPPGFSTLTRTSKAISMDLHTSGLPAGDAVTIWWMVFNHPEACISGTSTPDPDDPRCGMADMANPAADLSVLYAAGHVIDDSGVADFGGKLAVDDADGAIMGSGLQDPAGADVTLVVHDHGPADPATVSQQIHTFGTCNPGCIDLQMSVHQAS